MSELVRRQDDLVREQAAQLEQLADLYVQRETAIDELAQQVEELARDLADARDAAEAATAAKSAFIANLSHELRTPLNAVLGLSTILLDSPLDATQREHVETISSAGQHLLGVISDVLDLAKAEANRIELEALPFDPRACVASAIAMVRPPATARGLPIESTIDSDVVELVIGDEARLRQILLNLLSNAVKFTERGRVHVQVGMPRAGRLSIVVEDSGIGIPEDRLARLFQRFEQADASTARLYGGTGLGLAISRHLAELMGGELRVASRVGHGTTFTLEIVAPPGVRALPPAPVPAPVDASAYRARVLVVDDTPVNQKVARAFLERLGALATTVGDGAEAIGVLERQAFDLVLMDVQMPGIDGLEATRRIRARHGDRHRIVALTANNDERTRLATITAGMDDALEKPLQLDALAALLARHTPPLLDEQVLAADRIAAYRNDAVPLFESLVAALAARDAATATHVVQTLKSASAAVGARRLTRVCEDHELAMQNGELPTDAMRIEQLLAATLAALP